MDTRLERGHDRKVALGHRDPGVRAEDVVGADVEDGRSNGVLGEIGRRPAVDRDRDGVDEPEAVLDAGDELGLRLSVEWIVLERGALPEAGDHDEE
jgi:hypothetical protein